MDYRYTVRRRLEPLDSLNGDEPLAVSFAVHIDPECDDRPVLEGEVDWQDGVHLWQAEHLCPGDFIAIMATAHEAVCHARRMIGSRWDCAEPATLPNSADSTG